MARPKQGMNKGTAVIFIVAIIVALAAGFLVYQWLGTKKSTIYIFKGDYKAGTQIAGDMLSKMSIDSDAYDAMGHNEAGIAYMTADEISAHIASGDRLAVDVVQYMPVMTNLFISSGGTGVESRLDDNKVGVEILASKVYGLSGNEVRVGSRVNISSNFEFENTKENDLIFQDVLVLDVTYDDDGNIAAIYVEVEPKDSVMLQHALINETVSVAVLKTGAYMPIQGGDTSFSKEYANDYESYRAPSVGEPIGDNDAGNAQ